MAGFDFSDSLATPKKEEEEGRLFVKFDFSDSLPSSKTPSTLPFNGTVKDVELKGTEAKFAAATPEGYAIARTITDFIPYVNLAVWPSEREKFLSLDQRGQTTALLHEAFATVLWVGLAGMSPTGWMARKGVDPGILGKGFLKVRKAAGKRRWWDLHLPKEVKVRSVPIEDALKRVGAAAPETKVPAFSYHDSLRKVLKNQKFRKGEIDDVVSVMESGKEFPTEAVIAGIRRTRWGKGPPSKAFKEATQILPSEMRPRLGIKKGFREEFSPKALRAKHNQKNFERMLRREIVPGFPKHAKKKVIRESVVKAIFDSVREAVYPELKGAGFGDMTREHMANLALNMLEGRWDVSTKLLLGAGRWSPAVLQPARVVLGAGEEILGTRSNIYIPMRRDVGVTQGDNFSNILLYATMLLDRGLFKKVKMKGPGVFLGTRAKHFTGKVAELTAKVMQEMDNLMGQARKLGEGKSRGFIAAQEELIHRANMMAKELVDSVKPGDREAARIVPLVVETTQKYFDHLLGMYYKEKIPQLFGRAKLTKYGRDSVDALMAGPNGLAYEVDTVFATSSSLSVTEKMAKLEALFSRLRKKLEYEGDIHPWFEAEGEGLGKMIKKLDEALTYGKGMPAYLENYTPRLNIKADAAVDEMRRTLLPGKAFFTQARKAVEGPGEATLSEMVEARTWAQAKDLYLNSTLEDIVRFGKDLPDDYRSYLDSYISGILGIPSQTDHQVAALFQKTIGGVEKVMPFLGEGLWDARRVLALANSSNQLAYLAGIGFKPFSAMRNLFQLLLNVPGDLGGVKDIGTLAQGMRRVLLSPKDRAYLRSIGTISQALPETAMRPKALPFGPRVKGVQLPSMRKAFDLGLWMFQGTDIWNRYTTGGAVLEKWDWAVRKIGKDPSKFTEGETRRFVKAIKLQGRDPWVRVEIEDLLRRGQIGEAKAELIKNVVLDTQYGYSPVDAPIGIRKWGALSRTGLIFQSWWMNYGNLLEKWIRTGEPPPAKVQRMFTWMLSSTIALVTMSELWGKPTALRSTFFGPLPTPEFGFMPPHWKPVIYGMSAIAGIPDVDISARRAKAFLDSSWLFVPGGLQIKAFGKGISQEGFKGFTLGAGRFKFGEGFISEPPKLFR